MDADPRAVNPGFPTESSLGANDLSSLAFGSSRGVRSSCGNMDCRVGESQPN
jgi:hypothetical protein